MSQNYFQILMEICWTMLTTLMVMYQLVKLVLSNPML